MIKNILVPIDYSEASLNAMESAALIAQRNKSKIQQLHVGETDGTYLEPQQQQAFADPIRQVAEAMAGGMQKKYGITPETIFQEGFAGPSIVQTAFRKKADLVVIGAHGASGMREQFIGSTAYYVIKYANCPVLVIPEGRKWLDFDKILFPLRTSFGSFKRYEFIKCLSGSHPANLEIFTLSVEKDPVEGQGLELLSKRLNAGIRGSAFQLAVSSSDHRNISREILDRADRMPADLIVLTPAVDVINKQFFIGPFCQRIIHHSKVPLLYVR